jgi:hypothetical protein
MAVVFVTAGAFAISQALTAATQSLVPPPTPAGTSTSAAGTSPPTPGVRLLTSDELRAGDCIQGPPGININTSWPDVVPAVPCTDRHIAEIIYSGNYWPAATAFPGNSTIYQQAAKKCTKEFHTYVGISIQNSKYSGYYVSPQGRSQWNEGDRLLTCVVFLRTSKWPRGKALYASLKDSAE